MKKKLFDCRRCKSTVAECEACPTGRALFARALRRGDY